jgi:hypothetical protein
LYEASGLLAAVVIIGFIGWLNYGWILWNTPAWTRRVEASALRSFGDAWERQSRKLGGPHAVDCGRVRIRSSPDSATQCALNAFHNGKPFRVRYDLQGIDSNVSAGLVYTPEGKMYGLTFDGDPYGQGGTSRSRQRTSQVTCPVPLHLFLNPNCRLNCFSEDVAPHDVMSPNFESY